MANAIPQNLFNVQLTRPQLELISKLLDQELSLLESGYSLPNPMLLKCTFDTLRQHLKPTAEQERQNMASWVEKVYGNRAAVAVDLARPAL